MPKKAAATEMAEPGEGSKSGGVSKGSMVATALVVVTAASFYQVKFLSGPGGSKGVERDGNYLKGLAVACLALVGNAMVGAFRKILSQHNIGSAQQVGLAALIQGVCAVLHCLYSGDLKLGSAQEMKDALPPAVFWCVCVCVCVCVACVACVACVCMCLEGKSRYNPMLHCNTVPNSIPISFNTVQYCSLFRTVLRMRMWKMQVCPNRCHAELADPDASSMA